ncbi:MAG: ATP-dependent DNA helicase RecG [Gemmatimonadetes bacterium]|nr:ATP-dependent DNA helicase RecG [Gemmatimonadota bacterium]
MALRLDTPVQFLKGVGPRRAEALARLDVRTVEDLCYHIPHRYLDATSVTPSTKARVGTEVTVVGRVVSTGVLSTRRRLRVFRAILKDASGVIECAWPGQAFLERTIRAGQLLLVTGPVKFYHGRQLVPREQIVLADADEQDGQDGQDGPVERGVVLPIYPATDGLSHRQIRRMFADHLDAMLPAVDDILPVALRRQFKLLPLRDAFLALHRPPSPDVAEEGRRRLAFDELLDVQLIVARARHLAKGARKGPRFENQKRLTTQLKAALPFELTNGQKRAIRDVFADMVGPERLHRLLMGDVGTGKTVVALFAMLLAAENGYQAVFMAPTELLAEQHARTIGELLAPLGMEPALLVGRLRDAEKAALRRQIAEGEAPVVIGTHALIEDTTGFKRLGLVVIDEQHRFGVEQRAALIGKGEAPDVLLLSATPIPRTLALTLYGDLDISALRERPKGRAPVKTGVRTASARNAVYDFIRAECARGHQAYIVYPVIAESERVDLRAATTMAKTLGDAMAPLEVGLVHGQMKAETRDLVMRRFRDGEINILVATTVIEVGIDVANATVMVIEHPERFGLAQLHQLRGRVGRGEGESHCILLCELAAVPDRLRRFARTTDGFKIAELDLQERGMGELAGSRQSGGLALRFTNLERDGDLVIGARRAARAVIEQDPNLTKRQHEPLRRRIGRRYQRGIELFRIG